MTYLYGFVDHSFNISTIRFVSGPVENLARDATESRLKDLFMASGKVLNIEIDVQKGVAIVEMEDKFHATRCIQQCFLFSLLLMIQHLFPYLSLLRA
jgi:hypothetical protein